MSSSSVLDRILATTRREVARLAPSAAELAQSAAAQVPPRPFMPALRSRSGHLAVIAELKRASPSAGLLAADLDPTSTALTFEQAGAAALSVVTNREFFAGSPDDLVAARSASSLPTLRKDFVLDPVQVVESRALGADAILLVLAGLDDRTARTLATVATDLGMAVLVETASASEIERALALDTGLVGINARNLTTFEEDLAGIVALADLVPPAVILVAESAVRTPADAHMLAEAGFDAVLVGTALARTADVPGLIAGLSAATVATRS